MVRYFHVTGYAFEILEGGFRDGMRPAFVDGERWDGVWLADSPEAAIALGAWPVHVLAVDLPGELPAHARFSPKRGVRRWLAPRNIAEHERRGMLWWQRADAPVFEAIGYEWIVPAELLNECAVVGLVEPGAGDDWMPTGRALALRRRSSAPVWRQRPASTAGRSGRA